MKKGKIIGLGVGPGDTELMTVKACRILRESEIFAVPVSGSEVDDPRGTMAWSIAVQAVSELAGRLVTGIWMPMTRDHEVLERCHEAGALKLEKLADEGKNVVYLTLGDPALYCSFSYLQRRLERDGYATGLVSGVPSFCAAAAALNVPLAVGREKLCILPGSAVPDAALAGLSSCIVMKAGGCASDLARDLRARGYQVSAAENMGLEQERIFRESDEIPEKMGYFTILLVRRKEE